MMIESAVPIGLTWAAFMGGTTIGLMVLMRTRAIRTPLRRWAAFGFLALVASLFLGAVIFGVYVWPGFEPFLFHTVAAVSFVGFVYVMVLIVLFVGLIVLPMKRERSPRRGGFVKPQQGP
jgi:uncharacterized membrane protein